MNMNKDMVNRALFAAGRKMLADEKEDEGADEKAKENKRLRGMCKAAYLQTFLEALSEAPWTGGKRRRRLMRTMLPRPDVNFAFVYDLPIDCARPVELRDGDMFVIEGNFLCADVKDAELLYITNGRVAPKAAAFRAPKAGEEPEAVLSAGHPDELDVPCDAVVGVTRPRDMAWHGPRDYTDERGNHIAEDAHVPEGWPQDWDGMEPGPFPAPWPDDPAPGEDYPDYRPPQYEPKFYEYVEKTLAAKFALAENPRAHAALLQEAMIIKREALNTTRSIAAAKQQPSPWWSDRLGLGGVNR